MKYVIRQKWFQLSEYFQIIDEYGQLQFFVKPNIWHNYFLRDKVGNEIFVIKPKKSLFSPWLEYKIYKSSQLYVKIETKVPVFSIDPPPEFIVNLFVTTEEMRLKRKFESFFKSKYLFRRGQEDIATLSMPRFLAHKHNIDIRDDQDATLILAIALVVIIASIWAYFNFDEP